MKLLVVMDVYMPSRISAALLMHDFVLALHKLGHSPVVLAPSDGSSARTVVEVLGGIPVIRAAAYRTKDVGKARRAFAEWWLHHSLLKGLRASPFAAQSWDGIIWYSPTIFLGPLIEKLKRKHGCRAYLVLRDLFPDWALDTGVLKDGPVYRYFKRVERAQYAVADVIGVQTAANLPIVARDAPSGSRIEVLNNWMAPPILAPTSLTLSTGPLAGRVIFAYTGNMGAAQGMDAILDLSISLRDRRDIGFLYLGRGSELPRLRARARDAGLENVQFVDEVDSREVPGVLAQCHVGVIGLDPRNTTHNIPGKLITYLHAGLPVLANINPGNDLAALIELEGIGFVVCDSDASKLHANAITLAESAELRSVMGVRGQSLAIHMFSPEVAARQVINGLVRE